MGNKVIITHRYSQRSSFLIDTTRNEFVEFFVLLTNKILHPTLIIFDSTISRARFHFRFPKIFRRQTFSRVQYSRLNLIKYWDIANVIDNFIHPPFLSFIHYALIPISLSLSLSLGSIKRFQRTKLDNSLLDGRPRVFLDGRGGEGGGGGGLFRNGSMHVVRWRGAYRVTRHTTRITRIPP